MGAQQSDGGSFARRPTPSDADAAPGEGSRAAAPSESGASRPPRDDDSRAGILRAEALLLAALSGVPVDAEGERRAVAAFRSARDAGAHRAARTARVRRRDDWRPRRRRRARRSLKTTLSVLLASLTLGGVAYAAIGVAGSSAPDAADDRHRGPSPTAPGTGAGDRPSATPLPATGSSGSTTGPGGPATAPGTAEGDGTEAPCRAYERAEDRDRVLDSAAWQRLVAAAGGERRVEAYCARQRAEAETATAGEDAENSENPETPESAETPESGEKAGDTGNARNDAGPETPENPGSAGNQASEPARTGGSPGTDTAPANGDDGGQKAERDRGEGE
ncbi:hypothetical protein [Streptomyces sp. NPDC047725]|uniref:hypothetical protein n=1 Tax=Streptomyces sp. NPDC047725 TaxID=3365487 RepID=UPI0037226954